MCDKMSEELKVMMLFLQALLMFKEIYIYNSKNKYV